MCVCVIERHKSMNVSNEAHSQFLKRYKDEGMLGGLYYEGIVFVN